MGAELILVGCPLPMITNGTPLGGDAVLEVLRARIAALDDDVLEDVAAWFLEDEIDTEVAGWQDRVRHRLLHCLEVLDDSRRDTAELCLAGRWWIFAGGMSWGDAPSDNYELLQGLAVACVTEEPVSAIELEAAKLVTDGEA
jgi:hypothetical protein